MARDPLLQSLPSSTPSRTGEEIPRTTAPPGAGPSAGSEVNWNELRRRMRGALLRPGEPGFDDARKLFNPLTDDHIPAAVAQCESVADVSEAVLAAGKRVPLAARSGGHAYVGYSAPHGGLTIDLRRLSAVDVQPDGTAAIGAGAVLRDVYSGLGRANRCLPGGSCFTVGIAGLTLGGGIGVLQRKFGLTCDHLVAAEIVTADGVVRTTDATRTPDLFWALRGGAGATSELSRSSSSRPIRLRP